MNIGKYTVEICGNRKYEYEGYYLILIDLFNELDEPTGNKQAFLMQRR